MAAIYQAFSPGIATIKACVVDNRGAADLLVYTVNTKASAYSDSLWFITKNQGEATSKIHFGSRGAAQLLVYFVSNRSEARWARPHCLQGKL